MLSHIHTPYALDVAEYAAATRPASTRSDRPRRMVARKEAAKEGQITHKTAVNTRPSHE